MASEKRVIATPTEENSIGFRGGGGTGVTITGLYASGGPAAARGRFVDLYFDDYSEARSFANAILRYVGDQTKTQLGERDAMLREAHGILRLMHDDDEAMNWVARHMAYRNDHDYADVQHALRDGI